MLHFDHLKISLCLVVCKRNRKIIEQEIKHLLCPRLFFLTELSYIDRESGEVKVVRIVGEGDRTGEAF